MPDPLVSKLHQMRDREGRATQIVGHHRRRARPVLAPIYQDCWKSDFQAEIDSRIVLETRRGEDETVHAPGDKVFDDLDEPALGRTGVSNDHRIAVIRQTGAYAAEDRGKDRVSHVRHDDADQSGSAGPQARRDRVPPIAKLSGLDPDALDHLCRDQMRVPRIERSGSGGSMDPGGVGDVLQGCSPGPLHGRDII